MDDRRFDEFTRAFASRTSRRSLVKSLVGLTGVAALAPFARTDVADAARRWTRVSAALITASDARLLEVGRGRAMLVTESINVDPDGVPIEYGHSRWLSDAMTFVVE